eukprot:SAG31_NODE_4047_length_3638_cov_1.867477_2_plen_248_part_00
MLLPGHAFSESGPTVPEQLNLGAPTMHYDEEEQYYYTIGGGSITAGPVRSKTLAAGSWELSPRAPMAVNAADLSRVGLAPTDVAIYNDFFTEVWQRETPENKAYIATFLKNITQWNWGFTDPDFCCSDGSAPSYMLHTVSQQGMPANQTNRGATQFAGMETYNGTLNQWLRSYFAPLPSEGLRTVRLKVDDARSQGGQNAKPFLLFSFVLFHFSKFFFVLLSLVTTVFWIIDVCVHVSLQCDAVGAM